MKHHDFHIIEPSPWPILISFSLLILALGGVSLLNHWPIAWPVTAIGGAGVASVLYLWWRDVVHEGIVDKAHTRLVSKGLRIGMVLFILSEVAFFATFFGSLFRFWFSSSYLLDADLNKIARSWPPEGIKTLDPWKLPLLNTFILLFSGTTLTWSHHALLHRNSGEMLRMLSITVILGLVFSLIQGYEYHHATFSLHTEGYQAIYPSNFYITTGFHGIHVILGTVFLLVCLLRARKRQFTPEAHLGFEFAAWYWHFVDVVWLFLFMCLYWLGR